MFRKLTFKSPIIMILLDVCEALTMEHERIIRIWRFIGTAKENITGRITNFYANTLYVLLLKVSTPTNTKRV